MPEVSFDGLVVVAAIAVLAPLVALAAKRLRVPAVVLEIVAGIVVGPAGLGWVKVDLPLQILALVGLAFLLFLAGLEIDIAQLRGRLGALALGGWLLSIGLAGLIGFGAHAVGWVGNPALVAVALSATSLGLIVPVLKDAGMTAAPVGRLTIAGASIADFGAIVLLSLLFSQDTSSPTSRLVLLGGFVALVALVALAMARAGQSARFGSVLVRLQDGTAEIRVRIAVLLLVGFVALAEHSGLETILGAFLAGAVVNLVDRDATTHPNFRLKLEAIGYGFVVPVFFVTSGLRFDLDALLDHPSALARVPVFLVALLVVRAVPAWLYRRELGTSRTLAAGLLQASSLPFIVTATQIGVLTGELRPVTAAALVTAGLLSVVLFPPLAVVLLSRRDGAAPAAAAS